MGRHRSASPLGACTKSKLRIKLYKILDTINALGNYLTSVKSTLINSITLLKSAVAKGKIYMPNSIILGTSYHNLGKVYFSKGAYEKALKIAMVTLGKNHPTTKMMMGSCKVSDYDGIKCDYIKFINFATKKELWHKYYTAAPEQRRKLVKKYKRVRNL